MNWKSPENDWIREAGNQRDGSAVPRLLSLLAAPDVSAEQAYSIAWSLGRCDAPEAITALEALVTSSHPDFVKRMALEAIRALSNEEQLAAFVARYTELLPLSLRSAQNGEGFLKAWQRLEAHNQAPDLVSLYLIDNEDIRVALKEILTTVRLGSAHLPDVRWLFKAAEYRHDAEFFALLAWRFDSELATGLDKDKTDKLDERAWSVGTRIHFRRRAWRALRRLGESGNRAYTRMATALLLTYTQDRLESKPTFVKEDYRLEASSDGKWLPVVTKAIDTTGSGDGKKKNQPRIIAFASKESLKLSSNGKKCYYRFTALESEKVTIEAVNTGYGGGPNIKVWDAGNKEVAQKSGTYNNTSRAPFSATKGESYLVEVQRRSYWGSDDYSILARPALTNNQLPRVFSSKSSYNHYNVGDDAYAYNFVLYGTHLARLKPGTKAWRGAVQTARTIEAEGNRYPFADLWHRDLDALLELLRKSDVPHIHDFAAPILRQYPDFCSKFDDATLTAFLSQPFAGTRALALDQIFSRDLTSLDKELTSAVDKIIPAMLESDLDEERQRALTWVDAHNKRYLKKTGLMISMIVSVFEDIRVFTDNLLNTIDLTLARQKKLFDGLVKHLKEKLNDNESLDDRLKGLLLNTFSEAAATVEMAQAKELMGSSKVALQSLGLAFFGKYDNNALLAEEEYLNQLVVHDSQTVRKGVVDIFKRLVKKDAEFAKRFCDRILAKFTDPTFGGPAYNFHFEPSASLGKKSQLSEYSLKRVRQGAPDNDGALLALNNPTVLVEGNIDDRTSDDADIGFQFAFAGKVYTKFKADSNGWMSFAGHWGGSYSNYYAFSQNDAVGIFPWWADLKTSDDGYVRTDLIERNGEQVRVIEWRCWSYYGHSSSAGITLQFQVCLYKDSGKVEVRYAAPIVKGEPWSYYTKACGAAVNTTKKIEGNVRDFFGTNGVPAGSVGPYRTDLYDHGDQIHYPGRSNVGLAVSGGSAESMEAKYRDVVALLLKVFKKQLADVSLEMAQSFLGHSLHAVQGLGAELVVLNAKSTDDLPEGIMSDFLNSPSADVRKVGLKLLKKLSDEKLFAERELLFSLVISPQDDLRKGVKNIVVKLSGSDAEFGFSLLRHILAQTDRSEVSLQKKLLEKLDDALLLQDLALLESVCLHHDKKVRNVYTDYVEKLIVQQPAEGLKLGVNLLKKSHVSSGHVNDPGLKIFTDTFLPKLPLSSLEENPTFLYGLCGHERDNFSKAGRNHLKQLVTTEPDKRKLWTDGLVVELVKREGREGRHALLMEIFRDELGDPRNLLSFEQVWKMLFSSSDTTKQLGAECSQELQAGDVSLKQITELAGHPYLSVREKSWQMIRDSEARLKEHLEEGLRILDVEWDDSREFAFNFYREHFGAEEWTATILISIVDSVRSDVQQFGRELINRYFGDEDGPEYLEKLSQHPEPNVELFVTNYLERYASENYERLVMLKPYFMRVLCRVNLGRTSRDRVIHFLRVEAHRNEEAAKLAADIFGWLSATQLVMDKATYLEAMLDIQERFPNVEMPLKVKPVEVRTGGSSHAV
jgi:hypothetical protein